jgi:electron transfer flavoprotein alpha subunit
MFSQALRRTAYPSARLLRTYATPAGSAHTLLFLEHSQGAIEAASLSALTAAQQLKGTITALVVGGEDEEVQKAVEHAKKFVISKSA